MLQRNLAKITAINLAGIRPYHELSLALGDGKDYRDREKSVPLPLKEEGAYLVVCRGDDDYASGLVLVSPLELAVQEDIASGRVRVTAKDAVADSYVSKVLVKVIGSGNSDFVTGETDLRGIFKADAIRGETTVIARRQANRYAFFRGTKVLAQAAGAPVPPDAAKQQAPTQQSGQSLLENLDRNKNELQQQQRDSYRSLLRNRVRGVKAQGAFLVRYGSVEPFLRAAGSMPAVFERRSTRRSKQTDRQRLRKVQMRGRLSRGRCLVFFGLAIGFGVAATAPFVNGAEPSLKVFNRPLHSGRINPMLFGNFIELLDDLVPGMWAEMLE